jgi:Ti-type conjugative transfer relaxase TraA
MKPIGRASGRSAVAAAAYRAGESLTNERDGLTHDFRRRRGVEHSEIVIATGSGAEWALDRSALWNAAEDSEKRKDARVAREFEIALPHELSGAQRLALTREFAQGLADKHGTAVDFAIHAPHGETDERNFHAHLMMTTRALTPDSLGDKTNLERENKWLAGQGLPLTQVQLVEIRQAWEQVANVHLARAELDQKIDSRSHAERGLEIEPTLHMGVHATQMERRGKEVSQRRLDPESARRNAELIRQKPEQVLSILTGEKSVFDRRDVARTLHRYIDDPQAFQAAFSRVMASPALVELQAEQKDSFGRTLSGARYSTREMVSVERGMAESADRMAAASGFGVEERRVEAALAARSFLAEEQREAVRHVTGGERIAAVVGLAGAGKSTMLSAAREAWEGQGFAVHGAALSGKAAEGLEESSGIASRTLASFEHGWTNGRQALGPRDVLVIDEAGMVSSKQLAAFVGAAEAAGAKLVLVGDPEQLQPINAGAAFRAVAERIGFVELEGVRRQEKDWQRAASQAFARHGTAEGLASYAQRGGVRLAETREEAVGEIVRDVVADMAARPEGSRIVLAHRRADVRELNASIREARQERGELAGERSYATSDGERKFAPGDRIIFLENNRDLGVKNGMIGTVESVEDGRLTARLDQPASRKEGEGRRVSVSMADYAAVDHGYATTIHKSQGATVDRSFVLASETMDRHLTYVAMTRHREGAALYAGREEFADLEALSSRLSRSQAKETTLDYAERRGIAAQFGVESEIEVSCPARGTPPDPAPEKDGRSFLERRAAQAEPAHDKDPEQRRESFLELARSILAQSEASSSGEGARQRAEPPSSVPAPAPDVAEALARGKQAFDMERAIEDGFAAFKAEQAQELAREREATRLRLAEDARQRALAEEAQKLEQERAAQREAARQRGRGHGMER